MEMYLQYIQFFQMWDTVSVLVITGLMIGIVCAVVIGSKK